MTVESEKDLVAIGVLAARLQKSVRTIEAAVIALNMMPAMRLNYVPHFDGEQVEQIMRRLAADVPLPAIDAPSLPHGLSVRGGVPELRRPC